MVYEISEDETRTEAVIFAISATKDLDPTSLEPLTEAIDPDALEKLFQRDDCGPELGSVSVSFVYSDFLVTVRDRVIETTPILRANA